MKTSTRTPNHWWEELAPETVEKLLALTDLILEEIKINGVNRLIYMKISKDDLAQRHIKNFNQALILARRISIEEKLFTVVNEGYDILSMQMPSSETGSTRLDRDLENNIVFRINTLNVIDALTEFRNKLKEESSRQNTNLGGENKDSLINGKLSYNIDNREVKYNNNRPLGLNPLSDYGKFLIFLMSNLEKRVSYTQLCDAIGIDYKTEGVDPETDPSIKRQIQQIKKDLSGRLKKAGVPKKILDDLIVARDGYKMNKIS